MTKVIDNSNLGYLISKIKSAFLSKTDVVQIGLDDTPTANSNNLVKSGGVKSALDAKQDTLVSGTSIKTINNQSLLGSGNISISGEANVIETIKVNGTAQTPDANKAVDITVPTKLSDLTDDVLQGEYVPIAGGTMDMDAELEFVDYDSSTMPSLNTAYTHNKTTLEGTGMEVEQSKYTPASQMVSGNARTVDTTTKYDVDAIAKTVNTTEGGSTTTNTYTLTIPSKTGTVALTSDIPTSLADLSTDSSHRIVTDTEKAT